MTRKHPITTQARYSIKGGLKRDGHKDLSNHSPIAPVAIPKTLIIPLRQHKGDVCTCLVKVGDYVYKGQPLTATSDTLSAPVHASSSGTVQAIEERLVPHTSGLMDSCVMIQPDGKDDWGEQRLVSLLPSITENIQAKANTTANVDTFTLSQATIEALQQSIAAEPFLQRLHESGLVGLGGAAFPTAFKLALKNQPLKTLIINAAECEPYISCDDRLIREAPDSIIAAIQLLLTALKPEQCIIGIEDNKPEAIQALQASLEQLESFKQADSTTNNTSLDKQTDIHIKVLPSIYPSGDEKQLIRLVTGQALRKQTVPIEHGIVVLNVATIYALLRAVVFGEPLISRVVTVTGSGIQQPQNIQALIGTPFAELIQQAGGYTDKAEHLIMGGLMMGYPMPSDDVPVIKATNCILALAKDDLAYSTQPAMPCIRCGLCVEACPAELLPQQLFWFAQSKQFDKAESHHLFDCIECGCCSAVCPSHIPLVDYYRFAKSEIKDQKLKHEKSAIARDRYEFLQFRRERIKQEREAQRAAHKAALAEKKRQAAQANSNTDKKGDDKMDAIQAALARAKAKKAALTQRNTDDLSAAQQKQIDAIEQQRQQR